jgi:uncharacterized membrane protein YvbJ
MKFHSSKYFIVVIIFLALFINHAQTNPYLQIARLKYAGGGDWYNDPSAEVNLL